MPKVREPTIYKPKLKRRLTTTWLHKQVAAPKARIGLRGQHDQSDRRTLLADGARTLLSSNFALPEPRHPYAGLLRGLRVNPLQNLADVASCGFKVGSMHP